MPRVNYCRKCKAEVPTGESCVYCGAKLTQTGERISFGVTRQPVKDWFAWNDDLRIGLPALVITLVIVLLAEGLTSGMDGVIALLNQGLLWTFLVALAIMLLMVYLLLWLQGRESVHYLLDKDGVHALVYIIAPTSITLFARFTSDRQLQELARSGDTLEGYTLVRRVSIPWSEVRRVRLWRENATLIFYRPAYWQALAVRCPVEDFEPAQQFMRTKLKRFKKVAILPKEKKN